ncbi:hypothetical protein LH464_04310 [Neorhizobium sp. T786]|uniref:hypothetical protein n=1 Tax=Pseudorhizobium xiangyangii TaxID=2883104 RepID=UPI001CFF5746|nr:hypothetical protein [Neorhizobium xiangyangii]MCB5201701.1 hypothetical protein [Neorhizobium xiangyangii]
MQVQITRKMTVANDRGEAETFEPTGEGKFREDISVSTYQRLNRAGAAVIFVDPDGAGSGGPNMTTDAETATATDSQNGIGFVRSGDDNGSDDGEAKGKPTDAELEAMTKDQLSEFAATNGYTVDASKKKADIIADLKVQFPA